MDLFLRNGLEIREKAILKPYGCLSINSRGREYPGKKQKYRTAFQVDRDRIIHSKAFRRLNGKTQVFLSNYGDHYRTRLTHSLEVAQISRGLARSLGLNEDLAEAISLAHDLGHTPFGHAGEQAMDEILREFGMCFEHNEQSKRVVQLLEKVNPRFLGLNLSIEVIEGLMKHETPWDRRKGTGGEKVQVKGFRPSLEAELVNLGDEIAYQNHDVDDGIRSGILTLKDLLKVEFFNQAYQKMIACYGKNIELQVVISRTISAMIRMMIISVLKETILRINLNKITDYKSLLKCAKPLVSFSAEMRKKSDELRKFLMEKVYLHPKVIKEMERGKDMIKQIFWYYFKNPSELPYPSSQNRLSKKEKVSRIKDYIAGMTDAYIREKVKGKKFKY